MRAEEMSAQGCAGAGRERAESGAGLEPASCEKAPVRLLLQGELAGPRR